jgi:hypothetical protein
VKAVEREFQLLTWLVMPLASELQEESGLFETSIRFKMVRLVQHRGLCGTNHERQKEE